MNSAIFALGVGMLFATGTFLVLRRRPIKLLLGLGLLTHGVNLLIFSTAAKDFGLPPIEDYKNDCLHRFSQPEATQCNTATYFAALNELRDRRLREIEDIFYANYIETGVWPLSGGETKPDG